MLRTSLPKPCSHPEHDTHRPDRRRTAGARIITTRANGSLASGNDILFLINPEGTLIPVTTSRPATPQSGDTLVLLTAADQLTAQQPSPTKGH